MEKLQKIKVFLVDDHQIFIDGLKSILSEESKIQIVGEALNGREALQFLRANEVDLLITDLNMPEMMGVELARHVKAEFSKVKVIVLSGLKRKAVIEEVLKSGADSYMLKDTGKNELVEAINRVMSNEVYLNPEVSKILLSNLFAGRTGLGPAQTEILTNREMEILKLITEERSSAEIADLLSISKRTVETHRKNMIKKLKVRNSAGLVKYAVQIGLIEE